VKDTSRYTLVIPCVIPSRYTLPIQVERGLLYHHTPMSGEGATLPSLSLSLSQGITGYNAITESIESRSFRYTPVIPSGRLRYNATAQHSPGCAVCGGSTIVISRPLPGGGYETCSRCLIPPGWPPTVHPAWRRHMRAACR
jgi:hypothetical protein